MNLNRRNILTFSLFLLLVFFMEYKSAKFDKFELPSKTVLSLDDKIFDMFKQKYKTNRDFNRYWGFSEEKAKMDIKENNTTTRLLKVTKKEGENRLCIASSCYRLLGIHYINSNAIVTLYNKKFKKRVKDYSLHETLEANITIDAISSHSVLFKELNSSRSWKFKLFDVNQTKYKPKDVIKDEN